MTRSLGKTVIVSRHSCQPTLTIACIEDGRLAHYVSRDLSANADISGCVYAGSVESVVPATQSCYVSIGHEKNAALYASDAAYLPYGRKARPIETLVRAGQRVVVQVTRNPNGEKGPRVSAKVVLPGKLAALLPGCPYPVSVSGKITDANERTRLKAAATAALPEDGFSAIVRTAAAGAPNGAIEEDIAYSLRAWSIARETELTASPPALLIRAPGPLEIAAELAFKEGARIVADDEDDLAELAALLRRYDGAAAGAARCKLYAEPYPIFAFYGVQDDVDSIGKRTIWLRSGAKIAIDRTEALTAIDVNAGKLSGGMTPDDAILRANTEAVVEAARQLRFRDISGIVVIDAIRMPCAASYDTVIDALNAELRRDGRRYEVAGVTRLGLIELARAHGR